MLMGIDTGGTSVKAVVFGEDGVAAGTGSHRSPRSTPHPRWAERDMDQAWLDCATACRMALADAHVTGDQIRGVGIVGHGDGLYPIKSDFRPSRAGILALDSRASELIGGWRQQGILDEVRQINGQQLFEPSQATLCAWLSSHEPDVLANTRWLLTAKDWLRLCLTGEVATDTSEATASFGNITGDAYQPEVARLLGIEDVMSKLPPALPAAAVAGSVTAAAAERTGLTKGTPVVIGTHDVVAGALGSGVTAADTYCVVVGTWGVNQIIADQRTLDARWQSRPWVSGNSWLHMATSPASASNLDWLLGNILGDRQNLAALNEQIQQRALSSTGPMFFPFLFGSPYGAGPSASFLGLRSWHDPVDLARGVFEGVVFNHLEQLDALRSTFGHRPIRLTGGGARSQLWGQLFADAADTEVSIPDVAETGCWGGAILAGVGIGIWNSTEQASDQTLRIRTRYTPDLISQPRVTADRCRYQAVLAELPKIWAALERTDRTDSSAAPAVIGRTDESKVDA